MAEETILASIADNAAQSFFEGSASSQNVITPEKTEVKAEEKAETKVETKLEGIGSPFNNVSANDLIGDLLEKTEDLVQKETETVQTHEEKPVTVKSDVSYDFLVEKGVLSGFEDDSSVKTAEDLENLIKGNKDQWVNEAKKEGEASITAGLPEEIKFLVDYAKKGGNDFQSIFKLFSQSEEVRTYDLEKPEGQRSVIRSYYATQGWTEDEIEEEIVNLADNPDRLKSQAGKLKPKLDQHNKEALDEKQKEQDYIDSQRKQARQIFQDSVVGTLKKGQLGDLKLTKEEQDDIYSALVKEQYQSLGGATNRLGALLDKIQYIEPNYELLAEVTWLLSDPTGFKKKIRDQVTTDVTVEQVKKIKTEQQKQKIGSAHNPEAETKKIPKLKQSFF